MDNSDEFQMMLNKAIIQEPFAFVNFDRTKNVQDQLQEMMALKLSALWAQFSDWLADVCILQNSDYLNEIGSMEQLWLAFCMEELYSKRWTGEEWEKKEIQ